MVAAFGRFFLYRWSYRGFLLAGVGNVCIVFIFARFGVPNQHARAGLTRLVG